MTRAEVINLLERVRAVYPREFADIPARQLEYKIDAWFEILKAFDFNVVYRAFIQLAGEDIKGFAPVVGAIAYRAVQITPVRPREYRDRVINGTIYAVEVGSDERADA